MGLRIGQLQYLNGSVRFHTSLDVSNMASKDPKYTGPHLVDPKLIANIFNYYELDQVVCHQSVLTSSCDDDHKQ